MADEETKTTTFTVSKETAEWLEQAYPDALGLNERVRNAIADARKVRDSEWTVDVHLGDD
jgi:hypothetical protein